MANTLTALIPTLYESLDTVSRELVGFLPAVALDASAARAAVGQQILSPITPAGVGQDVTPGVTSPNAGDQVIGNSPLTIVKSRAYPFRWNGEDQRGINSGPGYSNIKNDQITQAMRGLVNEMELFVAGVAVAGASRANGTAGTTPFASALGDTAQSRKILSDNGAPLGDLQMVINTTAGAAMRTLTQLTKANEAGNDTLLRQGVLMNVHGFDIRESAGLNTFTKGTGASYVTASGTLPVGTLSVPLITGTGTVLAGDVVTFAGDSNKYVVGTGVSAPGTIVLNKPGLLTAVTGGTAMTIGANYTPNLGFNRNAIVVATRAPALPEEGDSAVDRMMITDPRSGMSFEISMYQQYRQVYYEVSAAWGASAIKPEHITTLLG